MAEIGLPPPPKQHKSLFHADKPINQDTSSFREDVSNLGRRLRILEESFTNLRRALQVTEENMLSKNKTFATEFKTTMSDISDIKKEINEVKEKILDLVKELKETAKRDEVKVLEKYINFWNPVKFVTQNEVEAIIKEILKKEKESKTKK